MPVYHLGFDFGSYEPRAFLVWNIQPLAKLDLSHYLWVDGGFEWNICVVWINCVVAEDMCDVVDCPSLSLMVLLINKSIVSFIELIQKLMLDSKLFCLFSDFWFGCCVVELLLHFYWNWKYLVGLCAVHSWNENGIPWIEETTRSSWPHCIFEGVCGILNGMGTVIILVYVLHSILRSLEIVSLFQSNRIK